MALKVYRHNGHDYVYDSDSVPEGAELIGDRPKRKPVTLFPDQVKGKRPPTNKAAFERPANKATENDNPEAGKVLEEPNKPIDPPDSGDKD
jgi:hypothetical protein